MYVAISPISIGKEKDTRETDIQTEIKNHVNSFNLCRPLPSEELAKPSLFGQRSLYNNLFKDYKTKYGDSTASLETHRKVFVEENIGLAQPSQDQSEQCLKYKTHNEEVKRNDEDVSKCKICSDFPEHQRQYREARAEYEKIKKSAKDSQISTFTADMMKVFLIPKLTSKEHVFISRQEVFNTTLASLNEGKMVCLPCGTKG